MSSKETDRDNRTGQYLSLVQYHDPIRGQDSVEAMGDGQGGAVLERRPDGLLDQGVHLSIHGCCGLVQDQHLRPEPEDQSEDRTQEEGKEINLSVSHLALSQQSSGNTQKLSLSHREVVSILHYLRVQLQGQLRHLRDRWTDSQVDRCLVSL